MEDKIKKAAFLLYSSILDGIRELVSRYADGVSLKFLYRYVNDDCEQDIYRVKKVWVEDGKVFCLYDSFNNSDYPSDVYYADDDCFENEQTDCLSEFTVDSIYPFDVDFVWAIYCNLRDWTIPRLEED